MATSWTTHDLTAIETAIASGARTVKFADQEITYDSVSDLFRVRLAIQQALGISPPLIRQHRIIPGSGF